MFEVVDRMDLPEEMASMEPGPELARQLAMVDRERLSGYDRVVLLKARARQVAHVQAQLYADIESVAGAIAGMYEMTDPGEVFDTTASEIRAALSLTRRAAEREVDLAFDLRERLPQLWVALDRGRIDLAKARVICDQTMHLPRETAREVSDTALLTASEQTTGQLRAGLARLVISIDPASALERHQQRLTERRVVLEPGPDGTADLHGLRLPPAGANAAMGRINRIAKARKRRGDRRSIDLIRADILLELLTGKTTTTSSGGSGVDRGVVDIRVGLPTLTGYDDQPAEIPGWGPVLSDIARQIVDEQHDSEWRITLTDPNGGLLGVTTTRRRPTRAQKRAVQALNPDCVIPLCRMPSLDCDLDHELPWAQTHRTSTRTLEPLCRYDHINKEQRHWQIKQIRPRIYQLTSPLGHTYTSKPRPP